MNTAKLLAFFLLLLLLLFLFTHCDTVFDFLGLLPEPCPDCMDYSEQEQPTKNDAYINPTYRGDHEDILGGAS